MSPEARCGVWETRDRSIRRVRVRAFHDMRRGQALEADVGGGQSRT